jgi:hypothetical protein
MVAAWDSPPSTGVRHRGPSLLAVAIVFMTLFVSSLVISAAMAGTDAARVGAFLQFGSAIPLGIFTATAVSRIQFLGVNAAGTSIALFGGLGAASQPQPWQSFRR